MQKKLEEKLRAILGFALDKLAYEVTILNVEKICSYTDIIVVCQGTSTRQTQAIVHHIREQMKKRGTLPIGSEGESEGQWIILDYGEIVVHVFYEPARDFYNLEGIWPDAKKGSVGKSNKGGVRLSWSSKTQRKAHAV